MPTFTIPTMTCDGCAKAITNIAQGIDPQLELTFDIPAQTVQFNDHPRIETLREALDEAGFTPQ